MSTYMYNVAGIFVHRQMSVMWNVCKPVLVVTLVIISSSYEVYVLT